MNALILMYHRVAEADVDPWSLCVTRERFAEQMQALRKFARPCSLSELLRARAAGEALDNAVVVTFDDGYLDNLTNALPILERYDVPATVFVCSACLNGDGEFWWDQLERALLVPQRTLPNRLEIEVGNLSLGWDLKDTIEGGEDPKWNGNPHFKNAVSQFKFLEIWREIRALRPEAQGEAMRQIRIWSGDPDEARPAYRTLSEGDLLELAASRLLEIGAHTVSHPMLRAHPQDVQRQQIVDSRERLQNVIQRPINHFSYPFGEYEQATVDIVRESGFSSAVTTFESGLTPQNSVFELPRIMICNWRGDAFMHTIESRRP